MTTREKLDELLSRFSEAELEAEYARLLQVVERESNVASLPEGWGETVTGEPIPDVVAAVRRSRESY